jgi:hypothetical protein
VRVYGYSSVLTVSIVSLTAKVDHVLRPGGEWVQAHRPRVVAGWAERPCRNPTVRGYSEML